MAETLFNFTIADMARSESNRRLKKLTELLGDIVVSELDLVELTIRGVAVTALDRLADAGFTRKELEFIIPARTLSRRRAQHARLDLGESERLIRLASLLTHTESVFGTKQALTNWLRRPLKQIEGKTPLEAAKTEQGAKLIESALMQIDEGYFA